MPLYCWFPPNMSWLSLQRGSLCEACTAVAPPLCQVLTYCPPSFCGSCLLPIYRLLACFRAIFVFVSNKSTVVFRCGTLCLRSSQVIFSYFFRVIAKNRYNRPLCGHKQVHARHSCKTYMVPAQCSTCLWPQRITAMCFWNCRFRLFNEPALLVTKVSTLSYVQLS